MQGHLRPLSEPRLVRIACGICIGRVGFGSSRCSEGLLGRYGHWGSNQRPWAEVADGTSRARAVAVSRSHRRGREWPTPSNKKNRCRHREPVLLIGAASPTANPATDPPTSRPTYPRDREVPLACLVGEPCVRVRYPGLRCVVHGRLSTAEETQCRIATSPLGRSPRALVMAGLVKVCWERRPLSPSLVGLPGHFRDPQCRS